MLLWSREELGSKEQSVPVSHTQETSPFREYSVRDHNFIRRVFVRSLKFVIIVDYVPHIFVYVCGYTTVVPIKALRMGQINLFVNLKYIGIIHII